MGFVVAVLIGACLLVRVVTLVDAFYPFRPRTFQTLTDFRPFESVSLRH